MLEYLKSADDVLAFRIGGKPGAAELDDVVQRVERALQANAKTHMYMEVIEFGGFDLGSYLRHLPRSIAMLGQLDRFGRIAVVADQGWIRVWTRIESALLPGIRYEIYSPGERDVALAWVEGRRDSPHDPSISFIDTDNPDVVAFELDGRIRADELEGIAARFNQSMEHGRRINLLGRIKHVGGAELAAVFNSDYFEMKLRGLRSVERYAVVGGPHWLSRWVAMVDPLMRMEIRHFEAGDEAEAWQWVGAHPKAETIIVAPEQAAIA